FVTEDQGLPVIVFPGSVKLRYLIPFRDVSQTMKELRARADEGARLVVYADDGEKFGAWPGTYQRVHKDGWLEQFFSAIAQADFIQTTTLEDAWIFQKPARRIYIPGGSYPEMAEWALEPNAAKRYTQARNKLGDDPQSGTDPVGAPHRGGRAARLRRRRLRRVHLSRQRRCGVRPRPRRCRHRVGHLCIGDQPRGHTCAPAGGGARSASSRRKIRQGARWQGCRKRDEV